MMLNESCWKQMILLTLGTLLFRSSVEIRISPHTIRLETGSWKCAYYVLGMPKISVVEQDMYTT